MSRIGRNTKKQILNYTPILVVFLPQFAGVAAPLSQGLLHCFSQGLLQPSSRGCCTTNSEAAALLSQRLPPVLFFFLFPSSPSCKIPYLHGSAGLRCFPGRGLPCCLVMLLFFKFGQIRTRSLHRRPCFGSCLNLQSTVLPFAAIFYSAFVSLNRNRFRLPCSKLPLLPSTTLARSLPFPAIFDIAFVSCRLPRLQPRRFPPFRVLIFPFFHRLLHLFSDRALAILQSFILL